MQSNHSKAEAWRGQREAVATLIFLHGTDLVHTGLKLLFFGLFSVAPSRPGNFSADALASLSSYVPFLCYAEVKQGSCDTNF